MLLLLVLVVLKIELADIPDEGACLLLLEVIRGSEVVLQTEAALLRCMAAATALLLECTAEE